MNFLRMGRERSQFLRKNKIKSEILNNKRNHKPKCLSTITKNGNWQILTKNLVTFKTSAGVKDEKCWYYGGSPIFSGGGKVTKNIYIWGIA